MVLTATISPSGFEIVGKVGANEVLMVPGDPGDAITRGDALTATVGEGVLDIAATDEVVYATALKTVTMAAATTAFPFPAQCDRGSTATNMNTLIPVKSTAPAGTPIYKATFTGHWDDTVTSYTASTRTIVLGTGCSANDYPNGSLAYIWSGPGAGQVNVVEDYTHSSKELILHRDFEVAPTSASTVIIVGGEGVASRGIGFFNRIALSDEDALDATDGSNDGEYLVYLSFEQAAVYLNNLTLPVIKASAMLLA